MKYSTEHRAVDLDEFCTPKALIHAVAEKTLDHYNSGGKYLILDVGCNTGQWGQVFREFYPQSTIFGVEIMDVPPNPAYDVWLPNTDFLTYCPLEPFDLIVGNPPYSLRLNSKRVSVAERFVRQALNLLTQEGHLYYLLNTNMRHSRERLWKDRHKRTKPGLHQECHYKECYAVVPRPSFYKEDIRMGEYFNTTKTNAHNYDLYVWSKAWMEKWGKAAELDWEYD